MLDPDLIEHSVMSCNYLPLRPFWLPSPPRRGAGGEGRRRTLVVETSLILRTIGFATTLTPALSRGEREADE